MYSVHLSALQKPTPTTKRLRQLEKRVAKWMERSEKRTFLKETNLGIGTKRRVWIFVLSNRMRTVN